MGRVVGVVQTLAHVVTLGMESLGPGGTSLVGGRCPLGRLGGQSCPGAQKS